MCWGEGDAREFSCLMAEDEKECWNKACPRLLDLIGEQSCLGVSRGFRVCLFLLGCLQDREAILTGGSEYSINE